MANPINDYLVVSDIDGTLLQAGYGIPGSNLDAIERFVDRGGRFTVCTGRGVESVSRITDWVRLSAPAVLCNGSYIYDFSSGKVLYSDPMAAEAREVVSDIISFFPELGVEITVAPNVFVPRMNAEVSEHLERQHMRYIMCDLDDVPERWNKVVFLGKPEVLTSLEKYAMNQNSLGGVYSMFSFMRPGPELIDLVSKGTNKANGFVNLCEMIGQDINNTIVICDYYNDRELMRVGGIKVAVADAPAEIRAMADITVSSCLRGGVGEVLDKFDEIVGDYEQISFDIF